MADPGSLVAGPIEMENYRAGFSNHDSAAHAPVADRQSRRYRQDPGKEHGE